MPSSWLSVWAPYITQFVIVICKLDQICSILLDKFLQSTESSNNPLSQTQVSYLSRLISSHTNSAASLNTCCSSRATAAEGSTAANPSHHPPGVTIRPLCPPFTPSTLGPSPLCYELYYFDLSPSIRFNWIMICNHFLSGESIKWSRASAPPGRPPSAHSHLIWRASFQSL